MIFSAKINAQRLNALCILPFIFVLPSCATSNRTHSQSKKHSDFDMATPPRRFRSQGLSAYRQETVRGSAQESSETIPVRNHETQLSRAWIITVVESPQSQYPFKNTTDIAANSQFEPAAQHLVISIPNNSTSTSGDRHETGLEIFLKYVIPAAIPAVSGLIGFLFLLHLVKTGKLVLTAPTTLTTTGQPAPNLMSAGIVASSKSLDISTSQATEVVGKQRRKKTTQTSTSEHLKTVV